MVLASQMSSGIRLPIKLSLKIYSGKLDMHSNYLFAIPFEMVHFLFDSETKQSTNGE